MIQTSEASHDGSTCVSTADAADTTLLTSSPMTSHPPRRISALRAKRPARERQKKERYELLHSMTPEERRKFLIQETADKEEALERLQRASSANSSSQRIAIDLSFDSIMNDKELRSLANQLKLSYGAIKQMPEPFQLLFCNPSEQLEQSLERFGASNWYIQWRRGATSVADHLSPNELVYLSPDSPNVLEKMDPNKIYVIGGIVDKSRKKGATLNAATEAGITAARLPIQEHYTERLDHILNVNTVVDVLINFRELEDWPRTLDIALPQVNVTLECTCVMKLTDST
ncbi:tRNA (guanine-N(1)-)-methyltransferase [Phytophthora palmivora]|uniref:tRNA (guanine(9)-N(1))-methyltransferase n=1 Tax=Phytophthora palmivora TaxID=4796 RepID=A0A2P4XVP5_9STRA|nr:tRNA (guanine-N(1)-)-methyltransferase [Phytophthora palmivora]